MRRRPPGIKNTLIWGGILFAVAWLLEFLTLGSFANVFFISPIVAIGVLFALVLEVTELFVGKCLTGWGKKTAPCANKRDEEDVRQDA